MRSQWTYLAAPTIGFLDLAPSNHPTPNFQRQVSPGFPSAKMGSSPSPNRPCCRRTNQTEQPLRPRAPTSCSEVSAWLQARECQLPDAQANTRRSPHSQRIGLLALAHSHEANAVGSLCLICVTPSKGSPVSAHVIRVPLQKSPTNVHFREYAVKSWGFDRSKKKEKQTNKNVLIQNDRRESVRTICLPRGWHS